MPFLTSYYNAVPRLGKWCFSLLMLVQMNCRQLPIPQWTKVVLKWATFTIFVTQLSHQSMHVMCTKPLRQQQYRHNHSMTKLFYVKMQNHKLIATCHLLAIDQHREKWNSQSCLSSGLQQNQCSSKFLDWNAPCWSAQWQRGNSQVAASEGLDEGDGERHLSGISDLWKCS